VNLTLNNITILVLAAGSSSRMGQSKQLLTIAGETLLQRIVARAVEANPSSVVVVLGSNKESHEKIIADYPVQIVFNEQWQNGMGSSIKAGIKYIETNVENTKAVIITVCDQPHLTAAHFKALAEKFNSEGRNIVASSYNKTSGVPILFGKQFFKDLKEVNDAGGAKSVVQKNPDQVTLVPFPLGAIDLDTMEDYNTFNK